MERDDDSDDVDSKFIGWLRKHKLYAYEKALAEEG